MESTRGVEEQQEQPAERHFRGPWGDLYDVQPDTRAAARSLTKGLPVSVVHVYVKY